MLQVRKLVLAVAAATAVTSGVAHALGLGNVSVKSSLNQPLEAEIELLEVGGLTALEIKTQLASSEEFSRAGVERQFFLTGLQFTPVVNTDGKSVIRVTSERSVREPYLNFLVELLWPNGRMLREYTVLLDPPMYAPQEVVYTPASTEPEAKPRVTAQPTAQPIARQPSSTRRTTQTPAAPKRTAARGDSTYQVKRNDTLWGIATGLNDNAMTQQTMLAIRDLNPQAFINGDINRLKAGQVLTLPTDAQIQSRSRAAAIAEVKAQTVPRRRAADAQAQLDARHRASASAAPAQVAQQDSLRLVATETGQAATGNERGVDNGAAMLAELTAAKETLDSSRRENADLQEQVAELNEQVSKLQQLLELKNTQLANLQHLDAASEQLQPVKPVEAVEAVDEAATDAAEFDVADLAEITAIESETELMQLDTEPQPETEPVVEPTAAEPVAAQAQPEPKAVVPPVLDTPQPEQSLIDDLMQNPLFLPAVGGGSLLLLLLLLMSASRRRKKAKEAENAQELTPLAADEMPPSFDTELDASSDDELPVVDSMPDFDAAAESKPAASLEISEESDNTIAEADNYIAYGRFNQAADVLVQAIDKNPQRADLRFKLLEVFADLEDKNGFNRQLDELTEMGASSSELDAVKARYPHLVDSDPLSSLDEIGLETPELDIEDFNVTEPESEAVTDDLSDDFFAQLDDVQPSSVMSDKAESTDDIEKALLDLDELSLTLNDAPETAPQAVDDVEALPELDLSEFDDLDAELLASADAEPEALVDASEQSLTDTLGELDNLDGLGELVDTEEADSSEIDLDAIAAELEDIDFSTEEVDFSEFETESAPAAEELSAEPQPEAETLTRPDTELDFELPEDFDLSVTDELSSEPSTFTAETESELSLEETELMPDFDSINAELEELAGLSDPAQEKVDGVEPTTPAVDLAAEQLDDILGDDSLGDSLDLDASSLPEDALDDFDFSELEESLDFESIPDLDSAAGLDTGLDIDSDLLEDEVELSDFAQSERADQPAAEETIEQPLETTFAALEESLEDDFSFLAGTDETTTKLDLARAFVDMGDSEGAKDILEEVLSEGSDEQQQEARELMKKLS